MIRLLLVALLSCLAMPAFADSWMPAKTETIFSSNGEYRVTIMPRPLGGAVPYFRDKAAGIEPAGQDHGDSQRSPMARVERRLESGRWQVVWIAPLVNDVAPVSALLSNDGTHLATFDNWHSVGRGDHVVVIYGPRGQVVRSFSLEQILPDPYHRLLPRSISSTQWEARRELLPDGRTLELQVLPPGYKRGDGSGGPIVHIQLADGKLTRPGHWAWLRAMAGAASLESRRLEAWSRLRELRSQPLAAPGTNGTREWRAYARELLSRISGEDERMGTMVLAADGEEPSRHDRHDILMALIRFDANDSYSSLGWLFASADSAQLAGLLVEGLEARKPGSMKGARIAFVGTAAEGRQVAEAAAHAGATLVFVDRQTEFPPGDALPETPHPYWMPFPEALN